MRQVAIVLLVAAPLAAQEPAPRDTTAAGRLWAPGAVQQRAPTTARDNDSLVKAIEGRLRCTCGCNLDVFTCRTTDFTCATSPAMHRAVLARLDSALAAGYAAAQAADTVIARFEAQYGQSVLMAPPKRGFNWAAYVTPFVALGAGLVLLGFIMRRWVRARPVEAAADTSPAPAPVGSASSGELERLQRELERFEA
jgi:cytochrome c-type biogenesis protein CcmH